MLLRYYALIGTHILCILFGGWIMYNHDDVKALKLSEIQKIAVNANIQLVNQKLQKQIIINNDISTENQISLSDLQIKYHNSLLENIRVKKELDATNSINLLWLQHTEAAIYTATVPSISNSTVRTNAATTYINPSAASDRISQQLFSCQQNIIRFSNLQKWIKQTTNNYNK